MHSSGESLKLLKSLNSWRRRNEDFWIICMSLFGGHQVFLTVARRETGVRYRFVSAAVNL